MDQGPLVSDLINAGAKFLLAIDPVMPVVAAYWIKEGEPDNNFWNFYLIPDQVDVTGSDEWKRAYDTAIDVLRKVPPNLWLDMMRLHVVGTDNYLAKEVLAFQAKHTIPTAGVRLGPLRNDVLDGYLYPSLHAVSP